jgi:hypothetical protein
MKKSINLISGAVVLFVLWSSAQTTTPASTNRPHGFVGKVPWGVGFSMRGTVADVSLADEKIHFRFKGWTTLFQYPEGGTNKQVIKVNCERGVSATVTPDSFVAMTEDWGAGSVQNDKGRLLKILTSAAERGTEVRMSIVQPKMNFGMKGFELLDAKVHRITDIELR